MMKLVVLFLAVLAVAQGRPKNWFREANRVEPYLTWEDCGNNPMRPLKIHSLSVSPDPIKIPGTLTVSFDVENTAAISNMDLDLTIKKKLIIGSITIPCISGFGSCVYTDLCQYVPELPGSPTCPIEPNRVTRTNYQVELPQLPGGVGGLITGRYLIKLKFAETSTGAELGCFDVDVKLDVA